MQEQGNLFSPFKDTPTVQRELFDQSAPAESAERCRECGECLVSTQSGYWCCPRGHGRLRTETRPDDWPAFAKQVAAEHAERIAALAWDERCERGACRAAR
jgi:hypothetical protein